MGSCAVKKISTARLHAKMVSLHMSPSLLALLDQRARFIGRPPMVRRARRACRRRRELGLSQAIVLLRRSPGGTWRSPMGRKPTLTSFATDRIAFRYALGAERRRRRVALHMQDLQLRDSRHEASAGEEVRFAQDLYGVFSVKRLFWVCCQFFVRSGKAVLRPVACDQVPGARGRGQGTETLAELGGLPPSVACVSQRLDA